MQNINNLISVSVNTDSSPNWAVINSYQKAILEVKDKIKNGRIVKFFKNFIMIDGETYNIKPEVANKIIKETAI